MSNTTLDDKLIAIANTVVKASNWTFGFTRAQTATAGEVLGSVIGTAWTYATWQPEISDRFMVGLGATIVASLALSSYLENTAIDAAEAKSRSVNAMDASAEKAKAGLLLVAKMLTVPTTAFELAVGISRNPVAPAGKLSGPLLVAHFASAYIMNADYIEPRKDCISRAIDTIAEKIQERLAQTPEKARIQRYQLEQGGILYA